MADGPMGAEAEASAQEALLEIAEQVEAIGRRLRETHTSLPIPPNEDLMLLGEDEMDVSTEIRSVIECVLADSIGPAVRDLRAAATYKPVPDRKKGKKTP
jgi:predicted trehalose synthase